MAFRKLKSSNSVMGCLILILGILVFAFSSLSYGGLIIPMERHWICSINPKHFWQKKKSVFEVEMKVINHRQKPIKVLAKAQEITFEDGKIKRLDKFLKVHPATATLYATKQTAFKIHFPVPKDNSSTLVIFSCAPDVKEHSSSKMIGARVITSTGVFLGVSFYKDKWEPVPKFTTEIKDGKIVVAIENDSAWIFEGTIRFVEKGGEFADEKLHFFSPSNVNREFVFADRGYDGVILDVGGLDRMLGRRFQ